MKKYGILIGRFQPIHLAHQSIINEILHDGLIPLVFLGSCNKKDDKNPFNYIERVKMIHEIYGEQVVTLPLPDHPSDTTWGGYLLSLLKTIGVNKEDCCLYFFRKNDEFNISYLFQDIECKEPTYHNVYGLISATDIRSNPEKNKRYIDGRILKYLIKNKADKT